MERIPKALWVWFSEHYLCTTEQVAFSRTCKYLHQILPKKKIDTKELYYILCKATRFQEEAASYLQYFIHDLRISGPVSNYLLNTCLGEDVRDVYSPFVDEELGSMASVLMLYVNASDENIIEFCNETAVFDAMYQLFLKKGFLHAWSAFFNRCFAVCFKNQGIMSPSFLYVIRVNEQELFEVLFSALDVRKFSCDRVMSKNVLQIILSFVKYRVGAHDYVKWDILERLEERCENQEITELVQQITDFHVSKKLKVN